MTKQQAERLAKRERTYRARQMKGVWVVWCDASDHIVEFDLYDLNPCTDIDLGGAK